MAENKVRDNLIIVRAGPNSEHQKWLAGDHDRNWSLYVDDYRINPGLKFVGLRDLLRTWAGWRGYKYIVLADDDLVVAPGVWSRFFKYADKLGAAMAAPALIPGSVSSHPVTIQQSKYLAREVDFIEIMTPCFRVDVLTKLLPTFDLSPSGIGWGLDYLWAHELNYEGIYVIDDAPVGHFRPSANSPENARRGQAEMAEIMKRVGRAREGTLQCYKSPSPERVSPGQ